MASVYLPPDSRETQVEASTTVASNANSKINEKKTKNRRRISSCYWIPQCLKVEKAEEGNIVMEVDRIGEEATPTHLVIMINGIIGREDNWKYAAKQLLKRYPRDVIVRCSKSNTATLTFDGVDIMGERLAREVMLLVKERPTLQKISFICHSLGGLVARYAIALLYQKNLAKAHLDGNGGRKSEESGQRNTEEKLKGKIAGLEPINFITFATPHLGSRWHRQVPLFRGFNRMEKIAAHISWLLSRTGKHLFLTDCDFGKPPLLLQMVNDTEDLKFMSALKSFKRHVTYANVRYDYVVGWSTSSIRRRIELPKRKKFVRDGRYPHIVHLETSKAPCSQQEIPSVATVDGAKSLDMEEEMIRGLTQVNWERVDVDFSNSKQRFMAHSTIQVTTYSMNSDGADVIEHMIDNFVV